MNVYYAIWQRLKELHPNALEGVHSVMSDYERAAMTVATEIFPEARITGCWFHFNQVYTLLKKIKGTKNFKNFLDHF